MTLDGFLIALSIFLLRILNYSIGTIRMMAVTKGQRLLASLLAAAEAFVFAVVISSVVSNLENIPNLFAYCAGAGVGSWMGMIIEGRLIHSFMIVNVFTNLKGDILATTLRDAGFGVTVTRGEGKDGVVTTLRSIVDKLDVNRLTEIVQHITPEAFIALEEARGVRRGWLMRNHK